MKTGHYLSYIKVKQIYNNKTRMKQVKNKYKSEKEINIYFEDETFILYRNNKDM